MTDLRNAALAMIACAAAAILLTPGAAEAQSRSRPQAEWCVRGPTGGQSCAFRTLEQCRKAAHGTGGTCRRNPHYRR